MERGGLPGRHVAVLPRTMPDSVSESAGRPSEGWRLCASRRGAGFGPEALDRGGAGGIAEAAPLEIGAHTLPERRVVEFAEAAHAAEASLVGGGALVAFR